jgi:ABC-2 type transport system ATP-binding protein
MGHLVEARAVTVRFGTFTAVDSASLSVDQGEIVGLLGANGAGKTTLLLTLLGLLRPTVGMALLFGSPPTTASRRRVGYVPQTLGLYDDMTVEENWVFTCRAFGQEVPLPRSIADTAGELVGALPLGVQRRVAFAVAFSHRPEVLVLDEPTSGVSPLSAVRLWQDIREAASGGAGVLVTTHNIGEAEQCDRIVIMVDGHVTVAGNPDQVIGSQHVTKVASDDWRRTLQVLDEAGFTVQVEGTAIRVPAPVDEVEPVLARASITAVVDSVPANLEEAFVIIVSAGPPV